MQTNLKPHFNPQIIESLGSVIDIYDYFIIDLWGVLHDGSKPYPYSVEALKLLKANGKKIVLLSNAPRRAFKAKAVMDKLGFHENMYDVLLTSGELTYNYADKKYPGKNFFYIGPEKDADIFNGLNANPVKTAKEADFAVCTGFKDFGSLFEEFKHELDSALENKLTLICANPDKKVVNQAGLEQICAGVMADYYANNGGEVVYFGKPYQAAYDECFKIFGIGESEKSKVCAIGDSIYTDVKGASDYGIGSIFISSGIHMKELKVNAGEIPGNSELAALSVIHGANPDFVMPYFRF